MLVPDILPPYRRHQLIKGDSDLSQWLQKFEFSFTNAMCTKLNIQFIKVNT